MPAIPGKDGDPLIEIIPKVRPEAATIGGLGAAPAVPDEGRHLPQEDCSERRKMACSTSRSIGGAFKLIF